MVVRLQLARFGCKNKPFYRVMASDSRSPRDRKHSEVLGYYNPFPVQDGSKRVGLNFDRIKNIDADPDYVGLFAFKNHDRAGILPPPPMLAVGHKGGP